MFKRTIDILLSLIGIILVLPFFPVIALLIKLDSRGPVFFAGDRVGKDMKIFKMYKFRTMIETRIKVGESVSPELDPRVTSFGRFLRRTKMNELPQFINVLKGDMTFVGPRPETPDLAELYSEKAKKIFVVKPGLVGPNQILGRNEEELYPSGVDVKKYYIEKILPKKVEVDLEYINSPTFFKDFKYIFLGVKETLTGALSRRHIQDNRSQVYLLLADVTLSLFSYVLAYTLRFGGFAEGQDLILFFKYLPAVLLIRIPCFVYFGMYNSLIRYVSYHEILMVLKGVTCGSLLLVVSGFLFGFHGHSRLILIMDWIGLLFFLSGLRFGLRLYWEWRQGNNGKEKGRRVLIFGGGTTGNLVCKALLADKDSSFEVVGFLDDAPEKYSKTIHGLKILGNRYHIKALAQLYKVQEIILAMPNVHPDMLSKIIDICQEAGLRYRIFSSVRNLDIVRRPDFPMRTLELSDMLPLQRIRMDHAAVKQILADKTVMINGSGGAVGLEL